MRLKTGRFLLRWADFRTDTTGWGEISTNQKPETNWHPIWFFSILFVNQCCEAGFVIILKTLIRDSKSKKLAHSNVLCRYLVQCTYTLYSML